jgi:multicomponent Na+:H+ antiporter subunit G
MNEIVTLISAALLVIGSLFALVASIGLLRLPDLYTRMHAASKAGTMGACLMLIALAIHAADVGTMSRALAGVVFFLLTAPVFVASSRQGLLCCRLPSAFVFGHG